MISEKQLPELRFYRKLESVLPMETNSSFDRLVVAADNDRFPAHRWFRFKEGFSADLLKSILPLTRKKAGAEVNILDPFCGAGTTLLSAQELSLSHRIRATGIERNPLIHFVARTKVAWPFMHAEKLTTLGAEILARASDHQSDIPKLTGLSTGRCMSRYIAGRLTHIRDAIRAHGQSPNHDALMLGLAAVVEQLSRTRKDGRALRLVDRGRQHINVALTSKWNQIASDVRFLQQLIPTPSAPAVILGDGRVPAENGIPCNSVDLILTSPPYPNNIDYSEVYKLELWLLGFINDGEAFLNLRKSTFRSHPTAAIPALTEEFEEELKKGALKSLLAPIMKRTKSSAEQYRHRLILGYAADLWKMLQGHYDVLRRGGSCAIVIGNSLHGGKHLPYLIPSDLVVSAIAQRLNFTVRKIAIARNFRRRLSGNHFLRESVIILDKQ